MSKKDTTPLKDSLPGGAGEDSVIGNAGQDTVEAGKTASQIVEDTKAEAKGLIEVDIAQMKAQVHKEVAVMLAQAKEDVDKIREAAKAGKKSPRESGDKFKVDPKKTYVVVFQPQEGRPGGTKAVVGAVNGMTFRIPRGVEQRVPGRIMEAIVNAIETQYFQDPATKTLFSADQNAIAFNVLGIEE
ncbi:MAG: hypothetical protein SVS15_05675 [Thermodesulfobacteriota bacterium]|nr:hypothetical protein [Thermodesulfobacteriota bacterium]